MKGKYGVLIEWEYRSSKHYGDPFNEIELDVLLTSPSGKTYTIPTFFKSTDTWVARYIPDEIGTYTLDTRCSDHSNQALHLCQDEIHIESNNNLPLQDSIQVSKEKLYLEKSTGEPFFWLADTWWMALSQRLSFPKDFKRLIHRRKEQGFNTIMLVAGLFPDMDSFDIRSSNEAGLPWEREKETKSYTHINPSYFDKADERIKALIELGLTPCIVGSWGYYLQHLGEDKMKQHWRYIMARWGAYPVVWCIAAEATMPYYLSTQREKDTQTLYHGWTRIASYIRSIEAFGRLITIHPTEIGRKQISDASLIDFNLIQSGHNGYDSVQNSVKLITKESDKKPLMPLIMGESNYEGILRDTHAAVQRLTFWSSILSGAKGYTYGANGIWQINTQEQPFGASPHGGIWGNTPWQESLLYQGAEQLGYAKDLLKKYPWWKLEAQQHTLTPYSHLKNPREPRIAGISTSLRIIYFYDPITPWQEAKYRITHLEKDTLYHALFWDPQRAKTYPVGIIQTSTRGEWEIPSPPTLEDWVLILEIEAKKKDETYSGFRKIKKSFMTQLKYQIKHFFQK